jgi:hypothetical protein
VPEKSWLKNAEKAGFSRKRHKSARKCKREGLNLTDHTGGAGQYRPLQRAVLTCTPNRHVL